MRFWISVFSTVVLVSFLVGCGGKGNEGSVKGISTEPTKDDVSTKVGIAETPNKATPLVTPTLGPGGTSIDSILGSERICGQKPVRVTDKDIIKAAVNYFCSSFDRSKTTKVVIDSAKVISFSTETRFGQVELSIIEYDEWNCSHDEIGLLDFELNLNDEWESSSYLQFIPKSYEFQKASEACVERAKENQLPKAQIIFDDLNFVEAEGGSGYFYSVRMHFVNYNYDPPLKIAIELPNGQTADVQIISRERVGEVIKIQPGFEYFYNQADFYLGFNEIAKVLAYSLDDGNTWVKVR